MSQRVMMIGLLVISAVAMFAMDANAQFFDGFAFFGFSEITAKIDLKKVPDPDTKPSFVTIKGSLNWIEVICDSHGGDGSPQNAGSKLVKAAEAIDEDDITNEKRGLATVKIKFGSHELAAAEKKATCKNPKEKVVEGSAAPKQMSLTLQTFRCRSESEEDREPDFRRDTDALPACANVDTVNVRCFLKHIDRGRGFKPLHGQEFTCEEQEERK